MLTPRHPRHRAPCGSISTTSSDTSQTWTEPSKTCCRWCRGTHCVSLWMRRPIVAEGGRYSLSLYLSLPLSHTINQSLSRYTHTHTHTHTHIYNIYIYIYYIYIYIYIYISERHDRIKDHLETKMQEYCKLS